MPFYLSETIGDGSDAEDNGLRPAIPHVNYSAIFEPDYTRALVVCESLPTDPRWVAPGSVDWSARGVPIRGETTDSDVVQLAVRRMMVRQYLGRDDFPDLTTLIGAIPAAKHQRIVAKLTAAGIDFSVISGAMTVGEALREIMPQLKVRPFGQRSIRPSRSGTFTDLFTRSDENLEASADWTLTDGTAGTAAVRSNKCSDLGTGEAAYQCPDQSSLNNYTQCIIEVNAFAFHIASRITDSNNYIAARIEINSSDWEVFTRLSGSFARIILNTTEGNSLGTDVFRLEIIDDNIEIFRNATSLGSTTSTVLNTVTRQGFVPRHSTTSDPLLDNFEAGVLAAGGRPQGPFGHPFYGPMAGPIGI